MTEKIRVHTSDDIVYVMDDNGIVHVYEVEPDGSLVKVEAND